MKNQSVSQKIRTLIEAGHSNKAIVAKLQCNPRTVYNMRYRVNKDRGIAALGKPAAKTVAKPTRVKKPTPTVTAKGTGITYDFSKFADVNAGTPRSELPSIEFVGPEPMSFQKKDAVIAGIFFACVLIAIVAVWGAK